jgi:hypothetical protein
LLSCLTLWYHLFKKECGLGVVKRGKKGVCGMCEIRIERPSKEELNKLGISNWSLWECEPSTFDWEYSCNETAYVLEGKVKVETKSGQVEIKKGDLVHFPKGLKCTWRVEDRIRKVYRFD